MSGQTEVIKNIDAIFERRKAAAYALCGANALEAIQLFKRAQSSNTFWQNQSNDAMNRMFTKTTKGTNYVGFLMAHGVDYGVYLELANDGRHEAIRPIISIQSKTFTKGLKKIFE